jgi:hypothetical protein
MLNQTFVHICCRKKYYIVRIMANMGLTQINKGRLGWKGPIT